MCPGDIRAEDKGLDGDRQAGGWQDHSRLIYLLHRYRLYTVLYCSFVFHTILEEILSNQSSSFPALSKFNNNKTLDYTSSNKPAFSVLSLHTYCTLIFQYKKVQPLVARHWGFTLLMV